MRLVTQHVFGGADVLTVTDGPRPVPLATEVLVRVHAVGINPVEAFIRSGGFPLLGGPPFVLGWEISGVVAEVVPGTERFKVGDEVYGIPFFPRQAGGYAEYVTAPSRMLARKPAGLDHAHAAALPLGGLTAWQGLVEYARVEPGQRLLIHGAGGGVGHLAVQIAKARDADVVLDVIGGDNGPRSLSSLRPGGTFVTAVDRLNTDLKAQATAAGIRFVGVAVEPDHVGLDALTDLVETGRLRPHVEHLLPLTDIAKAHELVESGHTQGKIVVQIDA